MGPCMSRLGLWESVPLRQHLYWVTSGEDAVQFLQRACRVCKLRGADSVVDMLSALLAVDPATPREAAAWRRMRECAEVGSAHEYAAVTLLAACSAA